VSGRCSQVKKELITSIVRILWKAECRRERASALACLRGEGEGKVGKEREEGKESLTGPALGSRLRRTSVHALNGELTSDERMYLVNPRQSKALF
jgi:hypothetical protein